MECSVSSSVLRPGVSAARIRAIVSRVCEQVNTHGHVSVRLVGVAHMKTLNERTRGVSKSTDVLSFPVADGDRVPMSEGELGDIVICPAHISAQAKRFGVPFREEFTRSLVHATLHLAGYDHVRVSDARRMFALQEQVLGTLVRAVRKCVV